eukprot:TRINITY_DN585_c0_g1::TRINITY_DN585_c0_g1_i1::g.10590::m.10590 TRINITY_DN585_c0_g1::TRINITY_DN585_c0_g1_i1::g.10590  ORF type:complete len:191 (+),score=34.91,sp/Q02366/NDUA6_BOVIN/35.37/5e-11,Complex1_LYR/PF05347.10/0.0074 TRINITY_DN585_c0_g1_i1:47-574(+)
MRLLKYYPKPKNIDFPFTNLSSQTVEEAESNVRKLYRLCYRSMPWIAQLLHVEIPHRYLYQALRFNFEKFSNVKDPRMIDLLVFEGKLGFDEYAQMWKSDHHLKGWVNRMLAESAEAEAAARRTMTIPAPPAPASDSSLSTFLDSARIQRMQSKMRWEDASEHFLEKLYIGEKNN